MNNESTALTKTEGVAPVSAVDINPMALMQIALQNGQGGLEQLERLMDLQERWEKREAKKMFDQAFANFQSEPPSIVKDKKGHQNNKYASLSNIVAEISPALSRHGLSFFWRTSQENRNITVTCVISHVAGHSESTPLSAGADTSGKKNDIQAVASTISYLQRYTLLAATGLSTHDMDDDGNAAGEFTQPYYGGKQKKEDDWAPEGCTPKEMKLFDQWCDYIDQFATRSLDEWLAAKDQHLTEQFLNGFTETNRKKLKVAIREMDRQLEGSK